jgi:hypothetical protein
MIWSLLYLSFPYALFFVGWLKWYFALLGIGFLLLPLFVNLFGRENSPRKGEMERLESPKLRLYQVIILILLSLLLLSISGVGGYGYQDPDWFKHNTILKDLIDRPWPVSYPIGGGEVPLVYYLAYYLPAALAGKLWGWQIANHILFMWSFLGLLLAFLWFLKLNRRAALSVFLLFILFSGMDVIGQLLVTPAVASIRPEASFYVRWDHIENWSMGWQYSSNATLLFWVPHQALAGWIASGLFGYAFLQDPERNDYLLTMGLTSLWSPFAALGLLPFCLADIVTGEGQLPQRLRRYLTLSNISGLALLTIVGLFFSSKLYDISPLLTGEIPHGFRLSFAKDSQAKLIGIGLILAFFLLEFGLYSILVFIANKNWKGRAKVLFMATILILLLLPLYSFGEANDFAMRASIPALFFLAVFISRAIHNTSLSTPIRVLLIVLVLLGSATGYIEVKRHLTGIVNTGAVVQIPIYVNVLELWYPGLEGSESIVLQYLGSSQAPFFQYLARTL